MSDLSWWKAALERCEKEAQYHEAEAARWRGEKAEFARRKLAEAEGQHALEGLA